MYTLDELLAMAVEMYAFMTCFQHDRDFPGYRSAEGMESIAWRKAAVDLAHMIDPLRGIQACWDEARAWED